MWVVLSGKLDSPFYLTVGAVSSVLIAVVTRRLMEVDYEGQPRHALSLPWWRLIPYIPWLLWQIVLSSLMVARQVLTPKMPIRPRLLRIHVELAGEVGYLTLANSITLTPGTVTIDREGADLLIHALSDEAAEGLLAGDMQRRVAGLYGRRVERADRIGDSNAP
jgi:multicomponent Na+:H+ antiporter subunit E